MESRKNEENDEAEANGKPAKSKGVEIKLKKPKGVSDKEWKKKLNILNKGAKKGKAKVVHKPTRTGKVQKDARKAGKIKKGHEADHGLALQFGGDDTSGNITSTPKRINRSVGGQGKQRIQYRDGTPIRGFKEVK